MNAIQAFIAYGQGDKSHVDAARIALRRPPEDIARLRDGLTAILERKKAGGLKRLRFIIAPGTDATAEEILAEINRLDSAPDLPDVEVLGRYSPKV